MGRKSKKNLQRDAHERGHSKPAVAGTINHGSLPESASIRLKSTRAMRRRAAMVCGFLLLAVVLVFGRTVGYEFANYDDDQYVYENPEIAGGLTARGIVWAFTAVGHAGNWHPLTWLSHMLDCQLFGLHAGGLHLTNIILHAVSVLALFSILWRMTGFLWGSAFAAAVFAIHPLRVESVAWIAERKDVLSGFFFMLILWAYDEYARRPFSLGRYLAVVLFFALGLMAKPMLVTVPFVLLLLDYWPLGRISSSGGFPLASRRVFFEKLPLLALTAASCVVTFFAQSEAVVPVDYIPISARLANAVVSYLAYIGKLFYPAGLAVFYPHPEGDLPVWRVALSALAFAGISVAVWTWRRRFPYLFVGWFWYVGMLVPVIGLVQVGGHSMADRYTYLPQIGLSVSLIWGAAQLTTSWRRRSWVCGMVSALIVLVLMGLSWRQVSYWRNSEALWTHALACTVRNHIAHNNLGFALAGRGQIDEAIFHYRKALEIMPDYFTAHNNIGIALAKRGQIDEAVFHYQKALEIRPAHAKTYNNLGAALASRGEIDAAVACYRKVLEIDPNFPEVFNNLGIALAKRGQIDEAISYYRKALEIRPAYAKACNNLGIALARRGRINEAIDHFEKALAIDPNYTEARTNLRVVLDVWGRSDRGHVP